MSTNPEMQFVDSTNVEAIGYCKKSEELYVQFLSGDTYVYYNVPEWLYDEFMDADSKGKFLHKYIKKAEYQYDKL